MLDKKDLRILVLLERDGRLTKSAIACEVGLSPSACLERLRALERSRLIVSYNARIDVRALHPHEIIFTELTLGTHRAHDFTRFENYIRRVDAVLECFAVGGKFDYIMKSAFSTVTDYQSFMEYLLERELGVATYYTFISTKAVKTSSWTPIQSVLKMGDERLG
ncbi:MAG: Lrp/AsnC family transcriptional regulator [Pseudomonadota bacterium]